MDLAKLENITFFYPEIEEPALEEINLALEPDEFVLLTGPSGCGKTTLLEVIAGVIPSSTGGRIRGKVLVNGVDILRSEDKQRGTVGLVLQDPEAQLTNLYVEDEIAFGLENLSLPRDEIKTRLNEVLHYARLERLRHSFVYALSGGQKQRVAIAAGLAMQPKVLLMDGPTTNLDPQGAEEVLRLITKMRATGETEAVLLSGNKIDALLPLATRVIVMDQGRIVLDGTPEEVILDHLDTLKELGVFIPELGLVAGELRQHGVADLALPRTVDEAVESLKPLNLPLPPTTDRLDGHQEELVVEAQDVRFGYERGKEVLHGIDLHIHRGEFLAVVGQNGSGKTTMMKLVAGLREPQEGQIYVCGHDTCVEPPLGRVGYVFQYPDHQFVTQSVEEELRFGLRLAGLNEEERQRRIDEMLETFDLTAKRDQSPYILSMGEKRRLSVATMLVIEPEILILDEPTTGLDRKDTRNLMALLDRFVREKGITVIQVSHDMEQVAEYCSRVVVLDQGHIIFDGTPEGLFMQEALMRESKLDAPPVAALSQRLWPDARRVPITVNEFLEEEYDHAPARV